MKIILHKKFEMKNGYFPFVYNDNWITNGEFMINKKSVKDSFKYCVPHERAQADCDRLLPIETNSTWSKTDILYDCGKLGYLRVFRCFELDKTVCFKDEYINHFNIQSMKGNSEHLISPFISDNGMLVLMPCRNSHTDLT